MCSWLGAEAISESTDGHPLYAPPEYVKGVTATSRWKDIWSFGCIVFECLVWVLEREGSVGRFGDARSGPDYEGGVRARNMKDFFFLKDGRK